MSGSSPTSPSNVEVTQDDFRRVTFTSGDSPPPPRNELLGADQNSKRRGTMARRLGNILAKKASRNKAGRSDSSNVSVSAINDNATLYSMEGQQSVAAVTVHSQVTVKASNKHEKIKAGEGGETSSKPAKGWKKLKRLVGVKDSDEAPPRERLKSIDSESEKSTKSLSAGSSLWSSYPLRNRVLSVDGFLRRKTQKGKSKSRKELTEQSLGDKGRRNQLDLAIRGRLDGIDVLSLGSVNRPCLPPIYQETSSSPVDLDDDQIDLDPLRLAFTEIPTACTTSEIVSDMIWASAGKDKPELIFEGFIPGGGDRWVVRLEEPLKLQLSESASNNGISSPKRTTVHDNDDESTAVSTDDGSTKLPVQKLWNNLWGDEAPPPAPSHMQLENDGGESDDVIQLAAACSVPIDLDEDTFIIDSPEHLRSVHDLATIRIQVRNEGAFAFGLADLLMNLLQCHKGTTI